ncbi:MAG: hypothetical protein LBC84_00545 [Prevotellaceae bacterium]|jgi:hypothetical protein|nr:hypothetical protein [Prevotellaceae bacterium]
MKKKRCYSFRNSYDLIPAKYQADFRNEMRVALNNCTNASFYNRMNRGVPVPTIEEYERMLEVFAKYSVKNKFDDEHQA